MLPGLVRLAVLMGLMRLARLVELAELPDSMELAGGSSRCVESPGEVLGRFAWVGYTAGGTGLARLAERVGWMELMGMVRPPRLTRPAEVLE